MSVGVRYVHKAMDRTIEDVGVLVPGVGEVFFIANPGEGRCAARSFRNRRRPSRRPSGPYDAVEFRLNKRFANRWSMIAGYTWSRLFGNYGGLASSDENGRTSPNVERYFDGQYLVMDDERQHGLRPAADRSSALPEDPGDLRHAVGHQPRRVPAGHVGWSEVDEHQPPRLQPDVRQRPRRPRSPAGDVADRPGDQPRIQGDGADIVSGST